MSAFIVEDACINRILAFMMKVSQDEGNDYSALEDVNFLKSRKEAISLGKKLHALNVKAVRHRYSDDAIQPIPYQFEELPGASDAQVLKSIHCFLYQCNEGEFDKNPLFKRMEKFAEELMYCMATNSEAYKKAEWE